MWFKCARNREKRTRKEKRHEVLLVPKSRPRKDKPVLQSDEGKRTSKYLVYVE